MKGRALFRFAPEARRLHADPQALLRSLLTYVSVAANYNRRDGDDWKTDTLWNSVVCFSNVAQQVEAASKGDLVHVTGRVRETSHGEANDPSYRTELIADTFSILAKSEGGDG